VSIGAGGAPANVRTAVNFIHAFGLINCVRLPRTAGALSLLPLYAGLPNEDQMRVFEPAERGTRKVILSTNIAEVRCPLYQLALITADRAPQASVTIENIRFVIDCGFVKVLPRLFSVCYPVHASCAQVDPYIQPDLHSFLSHRGSHFICISDTTCWPSRQNGARILLPPVP
jgi:hypothetical protein